MPPALDLDQFPRMVINADDFGLTEGINRAVVELFQAGALTSATLMARGPAVRNAVDLALQNPGLGVGCHIVLVDGTPAAPDSELPALLGRQGYFRDSLPAFAAAALAGRIPEQQIEAEATAQIRILQNAGIKVGHVDTHKHTHLFPAVARPVMRAAVACGVRAIRNPFEQAWSARHARGALMRKAEVTLLRGFQSTFRALLKEFDMRSTSGSIGVSATGSLDSSTLRALVRSAEPGTWELVCHPGYSDAALDQVRTRLRQTRDIEREALLAVIPAAKAAGFIQTARFSDL